jgi:hypothetical protein
LSGEAESPSILVGREGEELGSFSAQDVRDGLRAGRFLPTDVFFVAGMTEWRPLREWHAPSSTPPKRPTASVKVALLLVAGLAFAGVVTLIGAALLWRTLWPAKAAEPFPQTLALFRMGMLHDWKATIHRYGDEGVQRQFAEWSVEMWDPVAPEVGWSYWFNTAVLTGVALDSARPRTAFYHPWSDTFWLAEWDLVGKPRVVRSWFGAGELLRSGGQPPWQAVPLWLRGHGPRADALASALAQSIPAAERALRKGDWPDGAVRKDPARAAHATLCRATLLDLLLGIEPLRRSVNGEDERLRTLRAAVQGLLRQNAAGLVSRLRDAPDNTTEMRRAAAAIPRGALSALEPVCRLGSGGTAMVVLMPGQTSDFALATVWDVSSSRARLLRVDVLPFAPLLAAAGRNLG